MEDAPTPQDVEPEEDRRELRLRISWSLHQEIKEYADRAKVPLSSFAGGLLALGLGRWESGEYGPDPADITKQGVSFAAAANRLAEQKAEVSAGDKSVALNRIVRMEIIRYIKEGRLAPIAGSGFEQYAPEPDPRTQTSSEPPHPMVSRVVDNPVAEAALARHLDGKAERLTATEHRHVHRPGVVLDEFFEKGTRYRKYACADEGCTETLQRRT